MTVIQKIQALRRALEGRYHLAYERHNLCGRQVSVTCVADAEALFSRPAVLDPDTLDVRDDALPYWACVWSSALALARTLLSGKDLRPGERVLELGCGLGLVSAAACLKRARVTATDYQPDALTLARINCLQIAGLDPEARLLDWRCPPAGPLYSAILGSDLVYESGLFDPLIACLGVLLEPGGRVFFSEPDREIARPFYDRLADAGWGCEPISEQPEATVYRIFRAG